MKLRNKKTGDIVEVLTNSIAVNVLRDKENIIGYYTSLAELNEEWEDYEEPKEYYFINELGTVGKAPTYCFADEKECRKSIGNYFESKEEAEKAVEKLKAYKRLKDKGFKFHEYYKPDGCEPFIVIETNIDYDDVDNMKLQKDLDLLFGGEE